MLGGFGLLSFGRSEGERLNEENSKKKNVLHPQDSQNHFTRTRHLLFLLDLARSDRSKISLRVYRL